MNIEKLKTDIKNEPILEGEIPRDIIQKGFRIVKLNPLIGFVLVRYDKFNRFCELVARAGVLSERNDTLNKIDKYNEEV